MKAINIISFILLLGGLFFALFPHSVHVSLGLKFPHTIHVAFGIVLLVISGILFYRARKK